MSDEFKVKPVEQKRPSVMIATPMYGGMCTGSYVQGLLFTVSKMREAGISVAWCQITNESLITRARNELARVFLASDHDYLMFICCNMQSSLLFFCFILKHRFCFSNYFTYHHRNTGFDDACLS